MTSSTVRLYASAPYACNYLPNRIARSQVLVNPYPLSDATYHELIHHGFRRSGNTLYRPHCGICNLCIPIRIPVEHYQPNRSQQRIWRQHSALTIEWIRPADWPEIYSLYEQYQKSRHMVNETDNLKEQLSQFLITSPVNTWMVLFRLEQELKIVSVVDRLVDGLSAVYTFYCTQDAASAYGIYAIRWQIEYCKQQQLPYLYLGYWVPGSQKMDYKRQFRPFEILYQKKWCDFETLLQDESLRT